MDFTGKISNILSFTISETKNKIKHESRRIIFGILRIWIIWLVLTVVLVVAVGGWISAVVTAISLVVLLTYSFVAGVSKTKLASAKIVMEIPLDLATGILHEVTKETEITPDDVNNIKSRIVETVKSPLVLLYNPRSAADTIKALSDIVNEVTTKK